MKNLTPHRSFKGTSLVRSAFRPHYEHPWPADLPASCEDCGTQFRRNFNITHGPGRIGRVLRKIAYYGFLPGMIVGIILPSIIPGLLDVMGEHQPSWLFFGLPILGPLILRVLSLCMPLSRHLMCKKCGWNRDYKSLPNPKRPAAIQED
ncbi:MAG: hypothetical protein IZT59_06110 [Verrucomicrobia bacterium]|nr:hypothetical protein [Verrucomicrobiota bacterium]